MISDPMGRPLVCRDCKGSGMQGWGEAADLCSCCDGAGALPLMGWRRGFSLRRRRYLDALFAQMGSEL